MTEFVRFEQDSWSYMAAELSAEVYVRAKKRQLCVEIGSFASIAKHNRFAEMTFTDFNPC
ncbi:hypothetical protein DPMN_026258 [Dreissena polymorpha]|uniref:Uncharacterized protein n=1 Tax=Dreissena polymorpha TaxID=45954 RepID=A0A9D4LT33_DREPO|nr:hypothetical protein DPMN_026258 [Dreissena polymorpha]